MKPKPKKKTALEKYIDQLIDLFQPRLHLERYTIKWVWVNRVSNPQNMGHSQYDPDGYTAECDIDTVYYTIKFKLAKPLIQKEWNAFEHADIANTICHELAHVLTEEIYCALWDRMKTNTEREWVRRLNEKAVTNITTVVMGSLDQKWLPREY